MRAMVGDDNSLWKSLPGLHARVCRSTPKRAANLRSEPISRRPRNSWRSVAIPASRSRASWLRIEPITKAQGDVTADLLKRIGMNVDFVATDWGTVGFRRALKTPPGEGGWEMFSTWGTPARTASMPAAYAAIRANGDKVVWLADAARAVEKEVTAWFNAKSLDEEKAGPAVSASTGRRTRTSFMRLWFFLGSRRGARTSRYREGIVPFLGRSKIACRCSEPTWSRISSGAFSRPCP